MKAKKNRSFLSFLHKLYFSGDGEDCDSFEELEAELSELERLAGIGSMAEKAVGEISSEIVDSRISQHANGHDYRNGLRYALDRLKGEVQE